MLSVGLVGFFFVGVGETLRVRMENLTNDWRKLSLNNGEGGKLAVKKDTVSHEFAIVARFLT